MLKMSGEIMTKASTRAALSLHGCFISLCRYDSMYVVGTERTTDVCPQMHERAISTHPCSRCGRQAWLC